MLQLVINHTIIHEDQVHYLYHVSIRCCIALVDVVFDQPLAPALTCNNMYLNRTSSSCKLLMKDHILQQWLSSKSSELFRTSQLLKLLSERNCGPSKTVQALRTLRVLGTLVF